ncbi:MAG: 23S rRNA (pseudouridine1915-N3)-methyltransferase [Flavobacteriales bacterium]|jgi:23S rRNA (pseudouridine1915-N3)-methyltransferase
MKLCLLFVGKTDADYIKKGYEVYEKRLSHYLPSETIVIPDLKKVKSLSENQQKELEGQAILNQLKPTDKLVLLDEKGKDFTSIKFAEFMQKEMNAGLKRLVLVIGGPYGFSDAVYQKAQGKISLSKMTFSHQMVRMFLIEQVYRAMTILKNEPYHHE